MILENYYPSNSAGLITDEGYSHQDLNIFFDYKHGRFRGCAKLGAFHANMFIDN